MIPVAAGCAFAFQPARERPRGDQLHRRGRHLDRRLPRGAQHGRGLEAAAGPGDREQPLRLLDAGPPAVRLPRSSADRGPGYGIAAETVDGNDPDAMAAALDARRRPRPRRRGADADRGDARPHARPRRGRRLAQGRAARRARGLPRRRSGAGLRPPAGGGGRARRRDPRAARRAGSPSWSRARDRAARHRTRARRPIADGRLAAPVFAPGAASARAGRRRRRCRRARAGGPEPARPPTSTPSTRRCARRWSATSRWS